MLKITDSVTEIPGIGSYKAKLLENLEIRTIRDLIYHFPFRYEDTRNVVLIPQLQEKGEGTILVQLQNITPFRTRYGKFLIKAKAFDKSFNKINVVWFNQTYLTQILKENHWYLLTGKLSQKYNSLSNPKFEEYFGDPQKDVSGRLIPIYPETNGISSKWLQNKIKFILDNINSDQILEEPILTTSLKQRNYMQVPQAIREVHIPQDDKALESARKTLALTEMLKIALQLEKNRQLRNQQQAHALFSNLEDIQNFINGLPFKLTIDQEKAWEEIKRDLSTNKPMYRLLNGDVGSGKTIIAMLASLLTVRNGYSAIIMAPTTVLAKQHFQTFSNFINNFDNTIEIELNISSDKTRTYITDGINPKIIIGTHALLFENAIPNNTALVIVDEEHRFGVKQRNMLQDISNRFNKEKNFPHYLSMTATPIPRTLSQIMYGDMDISYIKTYPKHKKRVKTHYVSPSKRDDMFQWLAQEIQKDKNTQAFIIYPLIEESEQLKLKSLEETYKELKTSIFKDIATNIIHGKMKDIEKQKILKEFKELKFNILFATTVIEVGIDIPNASIMIIENAERYGLAQLHQLRGRVGRGKKQGHCFIVPGQTNKEIKERLRYFAEHSSGFDIAEFDLQHRGPGEVYGTIQTGIPKFKIADIFDLDLLNEAKEIANEIIKITEQPHII